MRRYVPLVVLLVSVVLWPAAVYAEAAGVDLVFLVDQSGSMMGKGAARGVSNDPNAKRIDAIRALEDRLVDSATSGMINRISVVEFGGRNAESMGFRPQVTLSRLEIPPLPPGTGPGATRQLIRGNLAQVRSVFRGDTDHAAAIELAIAELQHFRGNPPLVRPGGRAGDRKQVVVLITDGATYYAHEPPLSEAKLKAEVADMVECLRKQAVDLVLAVFGFTDERASDYWRRGWGDYWRGLATKDSVDGVGRAYLLRSDEEAVEKVLQVLSEIIPPLTSTPRPAERYAAPAYMKGLEFMINFKVPLVPISSVEILDPGGNPVPVHAAGDGFAQASVIHPQPGIWRLGRSGAPYSITPTPQYEDVTLVEPLGPIGQGSHVPVRFRVGGRGPGGLFEPQTGLPPVRFELSVTTPAGQSSEMPVDFAGQGLIKSKKDLPLDEVGDYQLQLLGKTRGIDGAEHTIFMSSKAGGNTISVNPAIPLAMRLEPPGIEQVISLFNGSGKVVARFTFYNPRIGAPLTPQEVLNSDRSLELSYFVEGEDPNPTGSHPKVPLTVSGDALIGELPIKFPSTRWDLLWRSAMIRLHVMPDKFWRPDFRFIGINGDSQLYLLSPPFTVRESSWSLWPAAPGLLFIVVLWLLARIIVCPWLMIRRDRRNGLNPRLVFKVLRYPSLTKEWQLKGISRMKPASIRVDLSPEGEQWLIKGFKLKRYLARGREVMIRVTYKPKPEKLPAVKVQLRARDDTGQHNARHKVEGLSGEQDAVFLLLTGKVA